MAGEPRTWDEGKRCASCCNGDRCDDPSHYDRTHCPHCKGTGWALWTREGLADFIAYLQRHSRNTPDRIAATLAELDAVTTAEVFGLTLSADGVRDTVGGPAA